MNKFKVGDEVRLVVEAINIANNLGDGIIYIVEGIKSDGIKFKGLFPYYHYSLFEKVKEKDMNKFKVGDKVVRVSETYGKAIKGEVYEVSGVSDNEWAGSCGINLKGHEGVSGKFNYESSCFDLYVDGILSPLEAAEALLKGEELEVIISKSEEWQPLDKHQNSVTIKNLKRWKFRLKPKTVVINGVEVVAPANRDDIEQYFYTVNFSENTVHIIDKVYIDKGFNYYWATKEGAQKALDAMLLPFKENNND